jgi:DNA recombination protein RmuC
MDLITLLPWVFALSFGLLTSLVLIKLNKKPVEDQSVKLLQQQLSSLQGQLSSSFEKNTSQVTQFLQQQSGQLQGTHKVVGERLDNAARVVSELERRMGRVEEATRRVAEVGQDIASLQEILRAPKLRGNLGEQLLGDLLAQMLPQDSYELQYGFKNGERVDAIIRTAHGVVSIDAKFPLENFQRMISAKTAEERKPVRKQFVADVKKHVDDISKKYIRPGEGTFDFALMYIPAENVYYEMISRDEACGESMSISAHAMKKQVVPVSPNTFYAYLNTILLGLRGMRVEKFAKEILTDMGRIRNEVSRFNGEFSLIGKHMNNASSAYEKAEKRLNRIDDKLGSFEADPSVELSAADAPQIQ